jgi:hypothetical protein
VVMFFSLKVSGILITTCEFHVDSCMYGIALLPFLVSVQGLGDCNCHMTSYCHLLHIFEGLRVESNNVWQLCLGKGKTAGS